MPQDAWSNKRERQYERIKEGVEKRGEPEKVAKEIASRTVNKERAQHGEAATSSKLSKQDMPAPKRGGKRSHSGAGGRTKAQLYNEARDKGISGRSNMTKAELEKALRDRLLLFMTGSTYS